MNAVDEVLLNRFSGDEKGYIRAWTLKDLLPRMNVKPLNFHGKLEYEVQLLFLPLCSHSDTKVTGNCIIPCH